jgi:hypothetical protein
VIRGESEDGVVLDGDDCACNVIEIYGSYTHVENLTIQNAQRALRFQGSGTIGNVARRIHARDVGLGFAVKEDQLDFTICDNELEGPLAWPHIYPDDGGKYSNVDGIQIMGAGHVVCHNTLRGWGDAMKVAQDGSRAIDFYGNDVYEAYDNGLEFDSSEGNVRAFRNRFTNTYATMSFQPVYGGPAYAWRNIELNTAHEQLKLHNETSGIVVLQNTFLSATHAWTLSDSTTTHDLWVQGNLFIGPDAASDGRTVDYSGGLDDAVIDGNGWFPDGRFDFDESGDWSSFAEMQKAGCSRRTACCSMQRRSRAGSRRRRTTRSRSRRTTRRSIRSPRRSVARWRSRTSAASWMHRIWGRRSSVARSRSTACGPRRGRERRTPSCESKGGETDGTGDEGTGGGETGGDDTMSDDSGTTGGDAGGAGDGADAAVQRTAAG